MKKTIIIYFLILSKVILYGQAGSLDYQFNAVAFNAWNVSINKFAEQNDGKSIIIGRFPINNFEYNNIARLNQNGTVDSSFQQSSFNDNGPRSIIIQNDGKILAFGQFTLGNL